MSDKENEQDAVAMVKNLPIAKRSSDINLVRNSNSVNSSTSHSVNVSVQGTGIHIGNNYVYNLSTCLPQPANQPQLTISKPEEEAKIYKKTRSVAELKKSIEHLNEEYLDIFSRNFGDRYKEVFILLEIDSLFVDRMYVDHFQNGSGEVKISKNFL